MLSHIEESPLYRIANPKSMAFFGASNNMGAMGTNLLLSMLGIGYEGKIYPVHPREEQVRNLKAYRSVEDLPEIPDVAVMVLPTPVVNEMLEACGRKGIRHAIIVSGGFREVGGDGVRLEQEMVSIADRYGIHILGPNGLGVANPHAKVNTTFVPFEGDPGYIGMASQSGSFVTQMFHYIAGLKLGFSTAFSVGNEANTDLVDALEYLGACPRTRVIAMYIEGITRGREFVEAARAIVPHKPIVALYIGGSETGRKAGFSHTGALAGPDELYDGIFRQSGIIRARSVTELFDFCWLLGSMPVPDGPNTIIQTHSGGPGAAAADACGRAGLHLPPLDPGTREKLAPFVNHTASIANPVDLTFSRNPQDFYEVIPRVLLEDPGLDMLLVYYFTPLAVFKRMMSQGGMPDERMDEEANQVMEQLGRRVAQFCREFDKPIVGYTWRSLGEPFYQALLEEGRPVFPDAERAARAMGALVTYKRLRDKIMAGGTD